MLPDDPLLLSKGFPGDHVWSVRAGHLVLTIIILDHPCNVGISTAVWIYFFSTLFHLKRREQPLKGIPHNYERDSALSWKKLYLWDYIYIYALAGRTLICVFYKTMIQIKSCMWDQDHNINALDRLKGRSNLVVPRSDPCEPQQAVGTLSCWIMSSSARVSLDLPSDLLLLWKLI